MVGLEAVFFDFDGVIVDTMRLHSIATDLVFKDLGVAFPRDKFNGMSSMRTYDVYKAVLPDFSESELRLLEAKKYSKLKELSNSVVVYPGFLEFLSKLSGFKIGVVSNSRRDFINWVLGRVCNNCKFDVVVSADDVVNGKPDPECYLKAASIFGVKPENCVVIEDSVAGVLAGKSAGMKVVALTHTHDRIFLLDADLVVDSFKELSVEKLRGLFVA
jgi:HAD superfamily hydrolase (TIGR01509 family)